MKKNKIIYTLILAILLILPIRVNAFQLMVDYQGTEATIEVEEADTIEAVKAKTSFELNLDTNLIKFSYGDIKLNNGRTLGDYSITPTTQNPKLTITLKEAIKEIKYTITEPVLDGTPDTTVDVEIEAGDKKIELKDIEVDWYENKGNAFEKIESPSTYKFIEKTAYNFELSDAGRKIIDDELDKIEYALTPDTERIINGIKPNGMPYKVINGYSKVNIIIETLIIGAKFPTEFEVEFTSPTGTVTKKLKIVGWEKITNLEKMETERVDENDLVEEGGKYLPLIEPISAEDNMLMDLTTVSLVDGKEPTETKYLTGVDESSTVIPIIPVEPPETSDNVLVYLITLGVSLIGMTSIVLIKSRA